MNSKDYFVAQSEEEANKLAERAEEYSNQVFDLAVRKASTPQSKLAAMISYFAVDFAVCEKRISDLEEQIQILLKEKSNG